MRVDVTKLLLQYEIGLSLSEIAENLEHAHRRKITLPGMLKHMKKLEIAGIVRKESGGIAPLREPDARKTIYLLEGKERVEKILEQVGGVVEMLRAGVIFCRTAMLSRKVQWGSHLHTREKDRLKSLLAKCGSEKVFSHLTEDEKRKVKFWKRMMKLVE